MTVPNSPFPVTGPGVRTLARSGLSASPQGRARTSRHGCQPLRKLRPAGRAGSPALLRPVSLLGRRSGDHRSTRTGNPCTRETPQSNPCCPGASHFTAARPHGRVLGSSPQAPGVTQSSSQCLPPHVCVMYLLIPLSFCDTKLPGGTGQCLAHIDPR